MSWYHRMWATVGLLISLAITVAREPSAQSSPWLTPTGGVTASARQMLAALQSASREGLAPEAYRVDDLTSRIDHVTTATATEFDADLTTAAARYLRDLHVGRIDPRQLDTPRDDHDYRGLVLQAAAADRLPALFQEYRPPFRQYDRLVDALARYRALASRAEPPTPPDFLRTVRAGERHPGVPWVRARLAAMGDLPEGTVAAPDAYDSALAAGVARFQRRHGLDADGVLGRATLAALRVPLRDRVTQIALALERLRWLPHQQHSRVVVINIPMFRLWAWDGSPARSDPVFEIGVIVGRAVSTETPVFAETMREVIFRPYWNVPRSIVRNEIRPAVERSAAYLTQNDMEIVEGDGDGSPVIPASMPNLERLWRGEVRVRQRPGPRNALGLIKFVFPNAENVYLHGTPAQALFTRARRDFSHGCVRVQDPVGLAEWVLQSEAGWPRERILAAMQDRTLSLRLSDPIDVLLFYTTAAALSDGTLQFADDIYQHDRRLGEALTRLATTPTAR